MGKRILLVTDGIFTPSGFGNVAKNIIENFCIPKIPNDFVMAHLSWQYVGNKMDYYPKDWEKPVTLYPIDKHRFGQDVMGYVLGDFKPDIILTLGDLWMVNYMANQNIQNILKNNNIKWYWYLPLDSDDLPEMFRPQVKVADKIISMSEAGKKVLDNLGIPNELILHGVDTDMFYPLKESKREIRIRKKHNENAFIIGCVNRNQDRKQIPRLVRAFSLFQKNGDKKDVFLHLHMDPMDPANLSGDFNGRKYPHTIQAIINYGVREYVGFSSDVKSYCNGINVPQMVETYNVFDVHASATSGEGFGLSTLESMACGIPNIITDYTSSPELVRGHGELVKVKTFIFGTFGTNRAIIDEEHMASIFEKLYKDWKNGGKLIKEYSIKGLEHAQKYDWTKSIMPKWKELLERKIIMEVKPKRREPEAAVEIRL